MQYHLVYETLHKGQDPVCHSVLFVLAGCHEMMQTREAKISAVKPKMLSIGLVNKVFQSYFFLSQFSFTVTWLMMVRISIKPQLLMLFIYLTFGDEWIFQSLIFVSTAEYLCNIMTKVKSIGIAVGGVLTLAGRKL